MGFTDVFFVDYMQTFSGSWTVLKKGVYLKAWPLSCQFLLFLVHLNTRHSCQLFKLLMDDESDAVEAFERDLFEVSAFSFLL